jgi:hypothetical protein
VLIVVDTLTYDEALRMHELLSAHSCTWFSCFWGLAPFTLPAFLTILTGLTPEEHRLWRYWSEPGRAMQVATIGRSNMADDWAKDGGAVAITGGGFTNGPAWRYDHKFRKWWVVRGGPTPFRGVQPKGFTLIHTYELHDYVLQCSADEVARIVNEEPWVGIEKRSKLLRSLERRIGYLLRRWPDHDVWLTSDHGEGATPGRCTGHGPEVEPDERLLHLPLIRFGPDAAGVDSRFLTQDQLRALLRGDEVEERESMQVTWSWGRKDEPLERRFTLTPGGIR